MKRIDIDPLASVGTGFLFVQTPFCGTCQLASKMLATIEKMDSDINFYEMNASLFPEFMQNQRVESVPCLIILQSGVVKEKIYAFRSIPNIIERITPYLSREK
ncbi:thioredoxin family protein [Sediminibacillus massiliensis]|uniref:thioredoxin family protein n=1 Tax=Sediminibacillus massiliensis TaxID=1926277 RepID=UPI0009884593|nr:thioredoxin family protein [Sediminibacillus massiliensis]